jgi:hypothetical protein
MANESRIRIMPGVPRGPVKTTPLNEARFGVLTALIDGGVDANGFDKALPREAVLRHARHEERYEFPHPRQHVAGDRLVSLAAAIRAAEAVAPTRPRPGTESATANAVPGMAKQAPSLAGPR